MGNEVTTINNKLQRPPQKINTHGNVHMSTYSVSVPYLGRIEVTTDCCPVQRRSQASVDTVYRSACLEKEIDYAQMIGTSSPVGGHRGTKQTGG